MRRAVAILGLTAVLAACSGGATAAYTVVDEGVLEATAGDAETVLSVVADGATTTFSFDALVAARTVTLTVHEPFLKQDVEFTGVPLADVVEATGAPDGATAMHTVALNDYAVDVPLDVLDHPDVILATHADGAPIALEDGGPIRIVFGDDHPQTHDEALWTWSLATIEYQ